MSDRRFERRAIANEPVELRWTDPAGLDQSSIGTIVDVSSTGARILLGRAVRMHTPVRVVIKESEFTARVTSCIRAQSEYKLGVVFDPEIKNEPAGD